MPRAKGERRLEILKALAQMLEAPKWERITTAALAERLQVSEAALYRHFASKAQMYEGLIEAAAERDAAFRECLSAREKQVLEQVLAKLASQARELIRGEKTR